MERKEAARRNRASYSLEPAYERLLKEIALRGRRNATQELRLMIDRRAVELGMTPINPIPGADQLTPGDGARQ
jgi:hypothetical protein